MKKITVVLFVVLALSFLVVSALSVVNYRGCEVHDITWSFVYFEGTQFTYSMYIDGVYSGTYSAGNVPNNYTSCSCHGLFE